MKKPDTLVICVGYTRKDIENIVVQTLFEQICNAKTSDKLEAHANALQSLLNAKTHHFVSSDTNDKIIILGLNDISIEDCLKATPNLMSKCFVESGRQFKKVLEITPKGAVEYDTYETMEFVIPLTVEDFKTYLV